MSTYIKENKENIYRKSNASTRPLGVEKKNLFNRQSAKNLNEKRNDKNMEGNESNSESIIENNE